jgi:hypothetical protein
MGLSIGTATKPFYLPHFDETEGQRAAEGSRSAAFRNGNKIHDTEFCYKFLVNEIQ